jgi:hypothetical protein
MYLFRDSIGNINSLTGMVDWIDKQGPVSPVLVFPANTNQYGATSITLQRGTTTDTPNGIGTISEYLYSIKKNGSIYTTGSTIGTSQEINNLQDGTYTWKVAAHDGLGNQGARSEEQSFTINTLLPSATILYSPGIGEWTSGSVLASITGFNKIAINLNQESYTFNDNGSFTFTFQDEAGNTGISQANVRWIDRIAPSKAIISNLLS